MRDYENNRNGSWWRKVVLGVLVGSVVVGAGVRIYRMSPDSDGEGVVLWGCGFKRVTGLDCPGCGATRAAHYLMHGEVQRALAMNPAFVVGGPVVLAGVAVWLAGVRRGRRMSTAMVWVTWSTIVVLVVGYWIARNQAWWPWPLSSP